MKRVNPTFIDRIKAGAKAGLATGAGSATLIGLGFSSFGLAGGLVLTAVAAGGVVLGIGAAWLHGEFKHIPKHVIDEIGHDKHCKVIRVGSLQLKEACELTKPYYKQEYVEFHIADKWRQKNPDAFVQVINENGEMCSCFGFVSMKDSCFDEFIRGRVKDGQFDEDDILNATETKKAARLYLSGVIVNQAGTYIGSKRTSMMASVILDYYKQYFKLRKSRTIYALAVSDEGEHLLREFDFVLVSKKADRIDRCNLYMLDMNAENWKAVMEKIPDWSRCYTMTL